MANIAINGFGRIGRLFFRQAFGKKGLNIVAINDLGGAENLAHLLQYDSVYRRFDKEVSVKGDNLIVGGKEIKLLQEEDPLRLPWRELGVQIVLESTGVFDSYEKAKAHVCAGAKRVVITAPSKDEDGTEGKTVLMGVNDGELEKVVLSSNASCTTNAASPIMQILSEKPGISKAILNTVHGYTATQALVDSPTRGKDVRRGRAAAQNIVPSTTGAASAVSRALPDFEGKFDGIAMRVPVIAGSLADITFISKKKTSALEVNTILKKAAKAARWDGIFTVMEDPIVSSDIVGEPYGAIADLSFTKVVDGNLVKVLSWYDNEWGYVSTLMKHVDRVISLV
ncbi:type I glyceraldehyde-3-phosphate dehydrogenase [bacterium]|nr:type I glyceraldehyde-3-phosphate dehydrogenase [bacterium]|tara:strand:+ start:1354 stop:2370 length:1017 start_codon:yes stop_codon:yes gene_type:complete